MPLPVTTLLLVSEARSIHTIRWANALAERGIAVHVASMPPTEGFGYNPGVTMHELTSPVPRFRSLPPALRYPLAAPSLTGLIRAIKPDLVNAHYAGGYGTTAWLATLGATVPYLLNVWGSDVFDTPHESRLKRWVVVRNLTAPTRVASTSRVMAEVTRELKPDLDDIFITPFGVDTDLFFPGQPRQPDDVIRIGTVKTMKPKYGIDTLIRAFSLVSQRTETPLELHLYGGGEYRGEYEALASTLGVADQVTFFGQIDHDRVPDALRTLDIFVALSSSESFGVAAVEAGAIGLPVVVSDAAGLKEVTVNGETGIVVPKSDPTAAADALTRLVADADLRHRMGQAGLRHVQANYTWARSVDLMLDAYAGTIESSRIPAPPR